MRSAFIAVLAVVAVGCAPTPAEVCKTGISTTCSRMWECTDSATTSSSAFQSIFGTSASDCTTKLTASSSCDSRKNYDDACTGNNAGKKYDLAKAQQCLDAIKAQSCADFLDATKTPAVCSQVCG
jgi:hypothetical protein